jgi:hypothetical protein
MTLTADYAPTNGHGSEHRSAEPLVTLEAIDGTGTVTIPTATLDDLRALSILTRTADHELLRRAIEWLRASSLAAPRTPKTDGVDGQPRTAKGRKAAGQ